MGPSGPARRTYGLRWRRINQREELRRQVADPSPSVSLWAECVAWLGAANGWMVGLSNRSFVTRLVCGAGKLRIPSWFDNYANCDAVIKEMDSFYQDEVNISLPHIYAFVYSEMKLADATKQELHDYLNRSRQILGLEWSSPR